MQPYNRRVPYSSVSAYAMKGDAAGNGHANSRNKAERDMIGCRREGFGCGRCFGMGSHVEYLSEVWRDVEVTVCRVAYHVNGAIE